MNILNFFKAKCMVSDDVAHTVTNYMQHIPTVKELQQINNEKLEQAKAYMGQKWILHPANATKRKETTC